MPLHPLAQQFDAIATAYEHGRPGYPQSVVQRLVEELEIAEHAPVLDLAAGTGKLTRALADFGLDVVAVEPQESMRAVLESAVGVERVKDGVAEAIPLGDDSVSAVTVADAFHWFDAPRALAEIARVLRPGGSLAVFVSTADWAGASWAHEVGEVISELRPEHPNFGGLTLEQKLEQAGGWSSPREVRLSFAQPAELERIISHIESISWIAAIPAAERSEVLARLRAIMDAGETPPQTAVHVTIAIASPSP